MTNEELKQKIDDVLDACLTRAKKCADGTESNQTKTFTEAASTLLDMRTALEEAEATE